ncbi:MAG: alpha/beta hydrolase [Phycisphaerales bacterium]
MSTPWQIDGAEGEPIFGDMHMPASPPVGVVLVAHGFKGYKDYGMFPRVAEAMAARGLIAHRFNFSHSGMTNQTASFARPDLFERDTWNKQVYDLRAVMDAVTAGTLEGRELPLVLFGHSKGGVSVLLTAGRSAGDDGVPRPAGVVSVSAPSTCNSLTLQQQQSLTEQGFLLSPSSRTGQELRIGRIYLAEQLDDPPNHDLLKIAGRIACPVLIVHGEDDPTVPAACAGQIAAACRGEPQVEIVTGADHVFNTPNPLPPDAEPSTQLDAMLTGVGNFAVACCAG